MLGKAIIRARIVNLGGPFAGSTARQAADDGPGSHPHRARDRSRRGTGDDTGCGAGASTHLVLTGRATFGRVRALGHSLARTVVDGHGRVFFNIEDKSELAVLDAQTLQIRRHYGLAPCEEPSGLAIDPKGRLYSVCRNGVMVVSDPTQGRVIGQAPIGHGADGVAWLDGKAYSANGRDGTISVVAESADGGRFETIATVPTAQGARTIAAEPNEHVLFSPTAEFKPQPASGAGKSSRPEAIPGTFRVLVLKDASSHFSASWAAQIHSSRRCDGSVPWRQASTQDEARRCAGGGRRGSGGVTCI